MSMSKSMSTLKIGIGYDVHKLVPDRKLILGGVEIEHALGLDGHSDADVLIHAIMDAILGAAKIGDIGKFFPDTDAQFKNISSLKLLEEVNNQIKKNSFKIIDIDSVICAQKPKLSPFRDKMISNIANVLQIPSSCVGIKATTTEGLGFEGQCLGISAQAVALCEKLI